MNDDAISVALLRCSPFFSIVRLRTLSGRARIEVSDLIVDNFEGGIPLSYSNKRESRQSPGKRTI
jgi:hypothetical protein